MATPRRGRRPGRKDTRDSETATTPAVHVCGGAKRSEVAKILVGVDGRSAYDAALETAAWLSRAFGAELHIVTVRQRRPWQEVLALDVEFPQPELDEYFREVEHQLVSAAADNGACVTSVSVSRGDPGNAILKQIEKISADMVVLCRNRRPGTGWHGTSLGGTSKKVVCGSPCPVVLVPSINPPIG